MPTPLSDPIVLLHGVGLDRRMWKDCVTLLAEEANVIAPDLLGHGTARQIACGHISLEELAAACLEALPGRVHLVGFSLGALIAQQLALMEPSRLTSLTLVSSVAHRNPDERAAVHARLAMARRDPRASQQASISRWTGEGDGRLTPAALAYVRDVLASTDQTSFLAAYEVFAQADQELWPQLPGIQAPTLVLTGADDPGSTPRMSEDLAQTIPHAAARIIPGARHLLPLEQPQAVADLILDHAKRSQDGNRTGA